MRFYITLSLCMLFSFVVCSQVRNSESFQISPALQKANVVIVKFNILDCISCTSSLTRLQKIAPQLKLILQEDYKSDSVDIVEKYGLQDFSNSLVWSNELFSKYGKDQFSEVMIVSGNHVTWRSNLKNLNLEAFKSYFISEKQDCEYTLPPTFGIKDFPGGLLLTNYVSDNQYILKHNNGNYFRLKISDSIIPYIYKDLYQDPAQLELYESMRKKNTILRPKQPAAIIRGDAAMLTYITYALEEVNGEDSIWGKIICIGEMKQQELKQIKLVENKNLQYGINEYAFFLNDNYIYFNLMRRSSDIPTNATDFKIIGRFKLTESRYLLDTILDFHLPDYLIKYKIEYNFFKFIQSENYVTFPLANSIFNISTGNEIKLPFTDSLYMKLENLMKDYKLKFHIEDLKYISKENEFTILYQIEDVLYVSKLTPGDTEFSSTITPFIGTITENNLSSYCLSHNGTELIFSKKKEKCLSTLQLL